MFMTVNLCLKHYISMLREFFSSSFLKKGKINLSEYVRRSDPFSADSPQRQLLLNVIIKSELDSSF